MTKPPPEPLYREEIEMILEYASSSTAAFGIRPHGVNGDEITRKTKALDKLAAMLPEAPDGPDA